MEEMNFDLDIEEDLIKKFLLHKLEEIKLSNSEVEQQISRRKEFLNGCVEKMASEVNQNILEITDTWQRILNRKWIIGIKVKNTSSLGFANNVNANLSWDSSTPLVYKIKTFCRYKHPEQEESTLTENLKMIAKSLEKPDNSISYPLESEWIRTDEVQDNLAIILSFEVPLFVDKPQYNISGILSYQFREKTCHLNIPNFKLAVPDVTDSTLTVKSFDVVSGSEEAYLSTLIANEENELIVRVSPNTYSSLEFILEFELMFKKVNILSKSKKFFYVDDIVGSNHGYLLMVEKEDDFLYSLNIFTGDQTCQRLMLQFLYKHVPNIIILPKKYKENLLEVQSPVAEYLTQQQIPKETVEIKLALQEFGKSLESQISLVETFCTKRLDDLPKAVVEKKDEINLNVNAQDYRNFRTQLADFELNSDLLYGKMEQFAVKSESASESE